MKTVLRMLLIGVAVFAGVSVLLARGISNPITALSGAAGRLEAGDYDTPVPSTSRLHEVRELAVALEAMREGIRRRDALQIVEHRRPRALTQERNRDIHRLAFRHIATVIQHQHGVLRHHRPVIAQAERGQEPEKQQQEDQPRENNAAGKTQKELFHLCSVYPVQKTRRAAAPCVQVVAITPGSGS